MTQQENKIKYDEIKYKDCLRNLFHEELRNIVHHAKKGRSHSDRIDYDRCYYASGILPPHMRTLVSDDIIKYMMKNETILNIRQNYCHGEPISAVFYWN